MNYRKRRNRKKKALERKHSRADMNAAIVVLVALVGVVILFTLAENVSGSVGEYVWLFLGRF